MGENSGPMPTPPRYSLTVLERLEAESIHILREAVAGSERPVMMYSVGKDSSVLLRLAQKAFHPGPVPFPLMHVDTSFKFPEMYAFRDDTCRALGLDLRVHRNDAALADGTNPWDVGTVACCGRLKTRGLLDALAAGRHDAVIGGARREEERSRAKERIFSFRDRHGQWDPRVQRPELWNLYNTFVGPGESLRVFPLSNWTELDVWRYIESESIPVVPLYFARERQVVRRGGQLLPVEAGTRLMPGEAAEAVMCRYRTLGCHPCTGAVDSTATTVAQIIRELEGATHSERVTRVIDHDQDGSMERKKREGYF
jgi:sulfate adenylyltransferase subunit 2